MIEVENELVRLALCPAGPRFDEAAARRRGYGSMKGQFEVTDASFQPMPEDELKAWEGRGDEMKSCSTHMHCFGGFSETQGYPLGATWSSVPPAR